MIVSQWSLLFSCIATCLVRLVIILWVVLEDLFPLRVYEILCQVVCAERFPPCLTVHEPVFNPSVFKLLSILWLSIHLLSLFNVEFSCAKETKLDVMLVLLDSGFVKISYKCQGIKTLCVASLFEQRSQLKDLCILHLCCMTGMASLVARTDGRIIIVIVFRI